MEGNSINFFRKAALTFTVQAVPFPADLSLVCPTGNLVDFSCTFVVISERYRWDVVISGKYKDPVLWL
jgi:hypothetical protein